MSIAKRQVITVHESDKEWHWTKHMLPPEEAALFDWIDFSNFTPGLLGRLLRTPHFGRVRAGLKTRLATRGRPQDLIICHGPRPTFYTAMLAGSAKRDATFVGMSFNYTDLPTGLSHRQMVKSYTHVDRFAVYSRMERKLYADYFDLPEERFDFIRWAVDPPIASALPRRIAEPYVLAMGSEARDYPTLMEAARLVPGRKIVLVVLPHNLAGLSIPDNVEVLTNLPWDDAWSLAWHAEANLVPLRSSTTPNGHRTIVGAMYLAKCNILTDSSGIRDYVAHDETGLLVPANDPRAFADAIDRAFDEPAHIAKLGEAARAFAIRECSPQVHVDYFREVAGLGQRVRTPI